MTVRDPCPIHRRWLTGAAVAALAAWCGDLAHLMGRLWEAGAGHTAIGALWLAAGALAAGGAASGLLALGHCAGRSIRCARTRTLVQSAPFAWPMAWWTLELLSGPAISSWTWIWPARVLAVAATLLGCALLVALSRREGSTGALVLTASAAVLWWADRDLVDARDYPAFHHAMRLLFVIAAAAVGWRATRWSLSTAVIGATAVLASGLVPILAAGGVVPGADPWARRVLLSWAPIGGELLRPIAWVEPTAATATDAARLATGPLPPAPPEVLDRLFPGRRRYNVVLVTIDTVRADRLSLYGYPKDTSPELRKFAQQAVVFDRAYAQYPSSPFSFLSFLTGRYATSVANDKGMPDGTRPVFGRLGHEHRRFFGVTPLHHSYVARNFPYLESALATEDAAGAKVLEALGVQRVANAETVLQRARQRIGVPDDTPYVAWVHLFDPHAPYDAHPATERFPATSEKDDDPTRHDGEIAYVDAQLGRFLTWLRTRPDWDRTVVVIHSDHGEGLGDHGARFHGGSVFEEQIHVPLLMRVPNAMPRRVAAPSELVDILPTLEELLGESPDPNCHGHSLVGHFVGPTSPDARLLPTPRGVAFSQTFSNTRPGSEAVVTERWKLIRDLESGTEHLFDLREDPGELHDLALDPPEVIAELRALTGAFHERAAGRAPWKSPTGNPTGHGVTALLKDGPDLFAADGDAAEEALTLARDMELPETVRMQLARLVVLLRKDRAADLLRDILPTASTDLRTLCARWAALVPAGDRLLVALAADPDPTVATTARASQAYLGDAGGLAENRDLPDSEVPLLEAWRLLARARHGDQRAIAAIAPLVATVDVTDAEFLVAAWLLARELPDLRLHVAMYLRFAFGAGSSLDRHALGLLLATDPTEEVLPILRTLVGAGSEVLARGLDAYLTSRGSARWIEPVTDLIHRIAAAHVAAGANDFNKTEEILNAADAVARQQGLHDWGIYLERRILHAYARLPAVALPDDRYPPIIQDALVRLRDADRLTTAKPLLAEIEIITPDDLRPGALARVHLRLSNKGGALPGGLLAAGPNLVVQVVDHRRGILQTLEIPIAGGATLPGESLCIPFVWTLAGRGNKAWIHVTVMTVGQEPSKQQAKPVRLLGAPSPRVSIYQPRVYANMTAAALLGPRSVNGIGRKKADGEAFRFLVSGHLYGSRKGPHPARSFRSAIPRLNALDAAFLVNCGDMMWELNDQSRVESIAVFKQLRMPLYNAPGNHELSNRARYVEVFGPTHGVFRHGSSLFVILDSEDDPWNLTGPQLAFLKLVARWAESRSDLDNVFLFAHKVLFADNPEYEKTIGRKLNAHDRFMGRMNFVEDIEPVLDRLATKCRVFWFSGDVGTKAHSDTLFFDRNRRSGVTYVATGIGDLPRDLIVEVDVDADGAVEMRPIPLSEGGAVKAMSAYGNEAWK